jgi:hypothetical protein
LSLVAGCFPPPARSPALLDAIGEHEKADLQKQSFGGIDGEILIDFSQMNWSRSAPPEQDKFDLETAVLHEIDEILGSGGQGSTLAIKEDGTEPEPASLSDLGPLDLYRYQQVALGPLRSFSTSPDIAAYFSIDGGATTNTFFNQYPGKDFGDWGDGHVPADGVGNATAQLQDAAYPRGIAINIGKNELIALDVIGYTLRGAPTTHGITTTNGKPTIYFSTVPGQTYQVYTSSNLSVWRKIAAPFVAQGIESAFTHNNPTGFFQFYIIIPIAPLP